MSELRGTTRERRLPGDIDIDDIVIEDINAEDIQPVDEFDPIAVDDRPMDEVVDDSFLELLGDSSRR